MNMTVTRISPKYSITDWKSIAFATEKDWQKAIDVLRDRIEGRFVRPIRLIESYEYSGFAVLALDCLLMETLQQFKEGLPESKGSRATFKRFLMTSTFKSYFDDAKSSLFYDQIRCGILHQAETKKSSKIVTKKSAPLVAYSHDSKGLVVNRRLCHAQLMTEFEDYLSNLRDPSNLALRDNFRKKMNHICRMHNQI